MILWFILAKDTLYLHKKKPLILKPVETTVEEENFRKRFSINELVYPQRFGTHNFGGRIPFYHLLGGMLPLSGYSFSIRGMPPTANGVFLNDIPLMGTSLGRFSPFPVEDGDLGATFVYRGDAPVEYDGFFGGIISSRLTPKDTEIRVGLPRTSARIPFLYVHYNNPTYVSSLKDNTFLNDLIYGKGVHNVAEDYSFLLSVPTRFLEINALFQRAWFSTWKVSKENGLEGRFTSATATYGFSLRTTNLQVYGVLYRGKMDLLFPYGSDLEGALTTSNAVVGIKGHIRNWGGEILFDSIAYLGQDNYPFLTQRTGVAAMYWSRVWQSKDLSSYLGVRLNLLHNRLTSPLDSLISPEALSYTISGPVPTFRFWIKRFYDEGEALKLFVGTAYQYHIPFIYLESHDVVRGGYFKWFPYSLSAIVGHERLLRGLVFEINGYVRVFYPYTFYDFDNLNSVEDTVLGWLEALDVISTRAVALSYGMDFTLRDKGKGNFGVSGTFGRSEFVRGISGPTPWEIRYSLSFHMGDFSALIADGVPIYSLYNTCDTLLDTDTLFRSECALRFTNRRSPVRLILAWSRTWIYRGWKIRFGIGNALFLLQRYLSPDVFDPASLYKSTPLIHFRFSKSFQ